MLLLAPALVFGPHASGGEEVCVDGSGTAAIRACQAALSAGSTRRSVFLALGRHLERRGDHAGAVKAYRRGLAAYPGDRRLQSRLKLAQSNLQEQYFLEQRPKKHSARASAEAKARFKLNAIRCKTLSGQDALSGCESALRVKPGDKVLQRRRTQLARELGRTSDPDDGGGARRREQDARDAERLAAERERTRALIAGIQDRLTRLGLHPGPVDGVPGSRTRAAIEQFAAVPGVRLRSRELDQALLDALGDALAADERARGLMSEAERRLGAGTLQGTAGIISEALTLAPWNPAIGKRGEALAAQLAALDEDRKRTALATELARRARDAQADGDPGAGLAPTDQVAAAKAEEAEQQRARRAQGLERLRALTRKLTLIEAEAASNELNAKLRAQQVLEMSWVGGATP